MCLATSPQVLMRPPLLRAPFAWNTLPPSPTCTRPPTRAAAPSPTSAVWCRPPACTEGAPTVVPPYTTCAVSLALQLVVKSSASPLILPLPRLRHEALPTQKCVITRRGHSLVQTPRNPRSLPMYVLFAAAAWLGPRWGLLSCLTTACIGHRCHTAGPVGSQAGRQCGSACVAPTSWHGSGFNPLARPPLACAATCLCCGRWT